MKENHITKNGNIEKNKEIKKEKIFVPKSNIWIASALLSGFLFAASNFLLSVNSNRVSNTREFSHVGTFFFTIMYIFYWRISSSDQSFNFKHSLFFDNITNKVNFIVVGGVILSTMFQICSGYCVLLAMEFSLWADINKGVITTLFSFTSVLMAVYSWFVFNEKLSSYNIFGILCMIIWISMLGFVDNPSNQSASHLKIESAWTPFYAIGFGILTCLFFCLRIIVNKGIILKYKVNSSDINVASQFLWGCVFLTIVLSKYNLYDIDISFALTWIIGGIINWIALLTIYHAYSIGYVGPATALSGLTPILHTIASSIHQSKYPSSYQIGWMLIGIFGCVMVSVGPFISEKLAKRKKD